MACYIRAFIHFLWSLAFIWILISDAQFLPPEFYPVPGYYLSKLAWLTVIDLYMQAGYHAYASYMSLSSTTVTSSTLNRFHFISTAIAMPVAVAVGILFWSLYLTDPKLLIPDSIKSAFVPSSWRNHSEHTLPALAMIVDHILWIHPRPNQQAAFKAILIFATLYIIDIHIVHAISGFWVYGIMSQLSLPFRTLFILACASLIYAVFVLGDIFNATLHRIAAKKHD